MSRRKQSRPVKVLEDGSEEECTSVISHGEPGAAVVVNGHHVATSTRRFDDVYGGGDRTDENYDSDSLSKSMKTETTTATALLLLLLHPRIREYMVCIGPICVIRPKGMCGAGSASVAATMTLFRSPPARALTHTHPHTHALE
ncbi:hypothetical protein QTP88_010209 [Uroleucon formosanum]